jgi:3-hydroxy-3-methylglutaryl CoA synthase
VDRDRIDGLYFASSTAPYNEKQSASTVAAALDLRKNLLTIDFTNTIRAGTNALQAALDAVKAGSARSVLVVASDCRLGPPGSDIEKTLGDGAAALLVGSEGGVEFEAGYSYTSEIIDQWRTDRQSFVATWEDRFVKTEGYSAHVKEAINAFSKQINRGPGDFDKIALYAPEVRSHRGICRTFKLDPKTQVQDPLFDVIGNTGVAAAMLMLVAAIEQANPNDRLLLVNYGDGCDLFAFKIKERPVLHKERKGVAGHLNAKNYLSNYEKYLHMRNILDVQSGRARPPMVSSAVAIHRDRRMIYRLYAGECNHCGRAFFPPQRICLYCGAVDQQRELPISECKGKLFTFCKDLLAETLDPPLIVSVVNLEGNLRFFGQMTDRDPDEVETDMLVEFTFRKFGEAGGFNTYFWKCRPVR